MNLGPIEVEFISRVSACMDSFCRVKIFHHSSQTFPATKHPKVTRLAFDRTRMCFTQQLQLLFGFLSPFLDNFQYPFFEVVEQGSE